MNKELKTKWLKALRSGRYRQGSSYLRMDFPDNRKPEYCCLGVLAQIQGARWNEDGEPVIAGDIVGHPKGRASYLTPKAASGLRYVTQRRLGDMNDGSGKVEGAKSFKEIADYIEKNL